MTRRRRSRDGGERACVFEIWVVERRDRDGKREEDRVECKERQRDIGGGSTERRR